MSHKTTINKEQHPPLASTPAHTQVIGTHAYTHTYPLSTWPDPVVRKTRARTHAKTQETQETQAHAQETQACVHVDDMSRLNATEVARVWEVRSTADIVDVLQRAANEGKQVSIRGTQHSMGGHTIAPHGYVIDMRHLTTLRYDAAHAQVTAGAGAQWSELIYYLNQMGKSPRTMQSYATFSVGGTIAVNAHGITSDCALVESVVSFVLVTADGKEVVCSRDSKDDAARELFSLVIGGYGLFGIITEVTMRVVDNTHLELDLLHVTPKEFARVYPALIAADADTGGGDVDIKLARLDITNLNHIELYVFRRASHNPTISPLSLKPREMSNASRLLYKWLAPTLKEVRFFIERSLGSAFDWSQTNERNVLMYESAVPLAQLYSPLILIDDTFILQEYFIPQPYFLRWIELAKPIYERMANHQHLSLLNTTIRFVKHDKDTHLAYSRDPAGSYAFVLYYRIRRTTEADEALKQFHKELADVTLLMNGTFYLPYRHHYTFDQLEKAYGVDTLQSFMALKEKYDPQCLFSSIWLREYASRYASDPYRELILKDFKSTPTPLIADHRPNLKYIIPKVSEKRTDSYRRLFLNPVLRRQFLEEFLIHVFNVQDPSVLFKIISKAVWDPENKTDHDVYCYLQEALVKEGSGKLQTTWNQLKQLREQKDQLASETLSIISRLGKLGQLHDYVSIGDNGKLVLSLRETLGMKGQVWTVHDTKPDSYDLLVVLERGSVEPLGKFAPIDYSNIAVPKWDIPDGSADLVTMNQGLHHLPYEEIPKFLSEVLRILRPGGLFIMREHDAKPPTQGSNEIDLIPMLDIAHSVFNVVTGVSFNDERTEIRAFRPVLQWREIVEAAGFKDTMLYSRQATDPTIDVMLCFSKPGEFVPREISQDMLAANNTPAPALPPLVPILSNILGQIPSATLDLFRGTIEGIITNLPSITKTLTEFITTTSSAGTASVMGRVIDQFTGSAVTWLERFRPFLESSETDNPDALNFIPPEIYLIIPAINKKVELGTATPMELVIAALLHDLQALFSVDTSSTTPTNTVEPRSTVVRVEDVKEKFNLLASALPDLWDLSTLFRTLEVPALAQRAIKSFWAASKATSQSSIEPGLEPQEIISKFADWVVSYLDAHAWKELSATLDEVIKTKATPPTLQSIIDAAGSESGIVGNDSVSLWARAFVVTLGSKRIFISHKVVLQLRFVGIYGLDKVLNFAHQRRGNLNIDDDESSRPIAKALEPLVTLSNTDVIMQEGHFHDIHNVQELISAHYGYTSLTTSPVDVTETIATCLSNNTLHLASLPAHTLQSQRESIPGWDRLRRRVTLNVSELTIRYRPAIETDPSYQRNVDKLLSQLLESGWVKPLHQKDGHFTWYKLPEWMQVEMVQIFGDSMAHTPWYRFPFMRFISLYFDVLFKEVGIVKSKHGAAKALFSNAFVTDLVPGLAMFFVFMQLQLMALPVKAIAGSEYTPSRMIEQIVILVPPSFDYSSSPSSIKPIKWNKIDERIEANSVVLEKGLYVLTVPTFKPFTEIILKIARSMPSSQILEISNQKVVQAKVILPYSANTPEAEAVLQAKISSINGCTTMFNYRYPLDPTSPNKRPQLCVSVSVSTSSIVRFILSCDSLDIEVAQLYDFYG